MMCLFAVICLLFVLLLPKEANSQSDVCGEPFSIGKIVGGVNATEGDWCWQASLHSSTTHFCAGSLVNSEWVLTAAHCFRPTYRDEYHLEHVYVGRQRQRGANPNEVIRNVTEIICHPDFDNTSHGQNDHDICLLKLSAPVTFTEFICPVCLAAANSTLYNGTWIWVAGWGEMMQKSASSDVLQEVRLPIVGNRQCICQDRYLTITDNMICAGLREGGKDSCQGDSGGPMVVKEDSRWVLAGVVSTGQGCARERNPGVYTRVSKYQGWINSIITTEQPGFVQVSSNGTDSDLSYTCEHLENLEKNQEPDQ